MNVAVVVLDTLRKDAFERHFDWLPGRRFDNAWSPSHWTVPVHGTMFTGRYPSETGVHAKNVTLDCDDQVLAERLSAAGYTTRAFSCNPYVSPVFGFDRGFEKFAGSWRLRQLDPELFDWGTFISETHEEGPTRYLRALYRCLREDCDTVASLNHGLRMKLRDWDYVDSIDDDGAAEALGYLRETDFGSQEFLYVNLMEAHTPYDPPEGYKTVDVAHGRGLEATISEGEEESIDGEAVRQAYDDCVRYLSDMYEDIFSALTDEFDYVVTLSDHGELLGEHGGWMHGYGLYRELTSVPLSVYGPEMPDGQTDDLVSLLDVHATVLDIATGGDSPRGHSLVGEDRRERCLTEYHGFTAQKLDTLRNTSIPEQRIGEFDRTLRGIARPEYYGFETVDDFVETGEGSVEDGRADLQDLVDDLNVREREASERELSDSVMSHLEDLGYA
jgi:arylsulfatase A-like enzyme